MSASDQHQPEGIVHAEVGSRARDGVGKHFPSCATRERGRKLYDMLVAEFRGPAPAGEVVLSFEGVSFASPSCLDEIVGSLVQEHPEFAEKLLFRFPCRTTSTSELLRTGPEICSLSEDHFHEREPSLFDLVCQDLDPLSTLPCEMSQVPIEEDDAERLHGRQAFEIHSDLAAAHRIGG